MNSIHLCVCVCLLVYFFSGLYFCFQSFDVKSLISLQCFRRRRDLRMHEQIHEPASAVSLCYIIIQYHVTVFVIGTTLH